MFHCHCIHFPFADFVTESSHENDDVNDDDDVEILPIPESPPFEGRQPALADFTDDDVIVWQDISLIGDGDDAECGYQTESDLNLEMYSNLYALCQPLLPGYELDASTEESTFFNAQSTSTFSCHRRRRSIVDDFVTFAECERSMTSPSFDSSKSPSIETLNVFELTDIDPMCSDRLYELATKQRCDDSTLPVDLSVLTDHVTTDDGPSTFTPDDEPKTENCDASTNSSASVNCLECDRTLAWLSRLRINQHRHFEACVLIGLCVGLCLGLGTGMSSDKVNRLFRQDQEAAVLHSNILSSYQWS
jgi:hypothetical protein